jgi:hypothetical protein
VADVGFYHKLSEFLTILHVASHLSYGAQVLGMIEANGVDMRALIANSAAKMSLGS